MNMDKTLQAMVDRFLQWPLPSSVCSDLCATKMGTPDRCGTNLLTADEAEQMLRYVTAPMQARIDALMLEFCPNDMSREQLENWALSQRAAQLSAR